MAVTSPVIFALSLPATGPPAAAALDRNKKQSLRMPPPLLQTPLPHPALTHSVDFRRRICSLFLAPAKRDAGTLVIPEFVRQRFGAKIERQKGSRRVSRHLGAFFRRPPPPL